MNYGVVVYALMSIVCAVNVVQATRERNTPAAYGWFMAGLFAVILLSKHW